MKKIFALILALVMTVSICGCSSNTKDTSSDEEEIIYEEIIVDETGSEIDNPTEETTTPSDTDDDVTQNTSNDNTPSDTNSDGNKNKTAIDYNTIVEIDIRDDIIRGYLNAKDTNNQYRWLSEYSYVAKSYEYTYDFQVVKLDWVLDGSSMYTVYFAKNADFSDAMKYETKTKTLNNTTLIPGETYYWKVMGTISTEPLAGGRVKVVDQPVRWIQIDGVGNVRDIGGWKTESGKTVKYGMIYRGKALGSLDKSKQPVIYVTEDGIATIKQLGLKTELDIRYVEQKFQTPGTGLNYQFIEHPGQYDNIKEINPEVFKASYKRVFELLSNESNYPFYAHCNAGADRTGTFVFIVNGLLGVSYEDLTRDFELTSFSNSGKRWRGKGNGSTFAEGDNVMQEDSSNTVAWGRLYSKMMDYGHKNVGDNATLQQSIEHWLINYIGVPQSQIDAFRNIMLK